MQHMCMVGQWGRFCRTSISPLKTLSVRIESKTRHMMIINRGVILLKLSYIVYLHYMENLKEFQSNGSKFSDNLSEKMITFSLGGICNLCLDSKNKEYLLKNGLIQIIYFYLEHFKDNEECLVTLITTLIFMSN